MEETRKQKTRHKEERQRLKFMRFLQNTSSKTSHSSIRSIDDSSTRCEVVIGDVRYQVVMGGRKLQKARDDINSAKATPKKAIVGGVTFLRKNKSIKFISRANTLRPLALVHEDLNARTFTMRCKLQHVDRAGQIRKTGANRPGSEGALNGKETATADDESDVSSEDDDYDEIDGDDVDSDGLDEELTSPDEENREISRQQDFIHF
ncbi:hypothetical protein GP486_000384 [Trichoglossum hirsutum]|uniref:Uncharacterized protein n=1 Tax=Trichoglossum hirsutum TaxID=265104 RepID=A0A9P8LJ25_9PEZI|nr:hypothetical protein GP486_000384 [Trichoglossum hirsutum]